MRSPRPIELIDYCTKTYRQVRIIGVQNPSIIIKFNKRNFVIYKAHCQKQGKYVVCQGEDRFYFDQLAELKKYIQ